VPVALACYQHQTYPNKELIIVDDGDQFPVDFGAFNIPSARIVRVRPGTPLGIKLNHGADAARGRLVMKMDDDDYYAPTYLETSVDVLRRHETQAVMPTIVFHMGFLFFELRSWEVRRSIANNAPGATLFFSKRDWERRPFRPVPTDEDSWFFRDHVNAGGRYLTVDSLETFVAIRHRGHGGTFDHTWSYQLDGSTLEDYLQDRPQYSKTPEELFPDWALKVYRSIHEDLVRAGEASGAGITSVRKAL